MKLSTKSPSRSRRPAGGPPRPGSPSLVDELVRAVRLDLEDVELPVQRIVRLRREAEVAAEDPVLDPDGLHVAQHCAPVDTAAAARARPADRVERDLDGGVGRWAERPELRARVVLLPAGDDRLVVGEEVDR